MANHRKLTPTVMGNKRFYVYEYRYPDGFADDNGNDLGGVVFYVGKGQIRSYANIQRADDHEYDAASGVPGEKNDAIRSIWSKGMEVQKQVVFEFDEEKDALHCEAKHIEACMSPYLTNISKGNKRHAPYSKAKTQFIDASMVDQSMRTMRIHPACIVNGKIQLKTFLAREKQLKKEGKSLVPILIAVKHKGHNGEVDFHDGAKVFIVK